MEEKRPKERRHGRRIRIWLSKSALIVREREREMGFFSSYSSFGCPFRKEKDKIKVKKLHNFLNPFFFSPQSPMNKNRKHPQKEKH